MHHRLKMMRMKADQMNFDQGSQYQVGENYVSKNGLEIWHDKL